MKLNRAILVILALALVVSTLMTAGSLWGTGPMTSGSAASAQVRPGTTTVTPASPHPLQDTIWTEGMSPTALGLAWTETTFLCFASYTLQYSVTSSNGPWVTFAVYTSNTENATVLYGMTPGSTYWWQEVDADCIGGSTTSNQLQETQPASASLSATLQSSTTAQFTWTNSAQYGGFIGFDSYQLMESINGGPYSPALTITTEATLSGTLTLAASTSYQFYLNTTDACTGCSPALYFYSASNSVPLGTPAPLVASAQVRPASVDVGQTATFTCAAAGGTAPYSYGWAFGDGSTGTGSTLGHVYSTPGAMTATCTVTDNSGVTSIAPVGITVDPAPQVAASVNHAAASPGFSLTFTATPTGGTGLFSSFVWTFGDGSTATGSVVSHSFAKPGSYTAQVTVTDTNGETAQASVPFTIANLSITAGESASSGVPGVSLTFTAAASGGAGGPYTFIWNFGDGATGNGSSVTHIYAHPGTYSPSVTVTDALGGKNATRLAPITIFAPLTALIQASSTTPVAGQSAGLKAVATGGSGNYSCSWDFGDANTASSCVVAHSWATSGNYTVTLTVRDSQGNKVIATMYVNVQNQQPSVAQGTIAGVPFYDLAAIGIIAVIAVVGAVLLLRRKAKDKAPPGSGE